MKAYHIIGIILISLFSCKNEVAQNTSSQKIEKELDSLSKSQSKIKLLPLSPGTMEKMASFDDFKNFKSLIETMETSNPYYIKQYADSIDVLISTVSENLSEDLETKPIQSRLKLLATESGLLKDIAEEPYPQSEQLLEANTKLLMAYNSLAIQLNELSLAIPENIEKELLKTAENLRDSTETPFKDEN
ncbi:MAG: hypothetical protein CL613_03555 [Aquimarina sp.]|nr:hypothetical protein [Aquimarina sp.]|tara:strand:- start:336 stop:902 length:567 start_codon:yes stop_codon:yes gene_type:complete